MLSLVVGLGEHLAAWDEVSWAVDQQGQGLDSAVDSVDVVVQPLLVGEVVEEREVPLAYGLALVGAPGFSV